LRIVNGRFELSSKYWLTVGNTTIESLIMFVLEWKPEITIGDVLTAISTILAAIGLVFAGLQLRQNALVQRAQFLLDITERYFEDSDVRRFYYKLDYREFTFKDSSVQEFYYKLDCKDFDPDFKKFIGSDEERWLDQLIYIFIKL